MEILFFIPWIIGALLVGALGKDRVCGFWESFVLSVFLSPFIGVVFTLASQSKVDYEYQRAVIALLKDIAGRE